MATKNDAAYYTPLIKDLKQKIDEIEKDLSKINTNLNSIT